MAARRKFQPADARDFDFSKAATYRKTATLKTSQVEIARKRQRIVTQINGTKETSNTAKPGDKIVTGPFGERYIIGANKFRQLYVRDRAHDRYVSKARVQALKLRQNIELIAPWGEKQRALKGGYVVRRVGKARDVYLIEEAAFKKTYKREAPVAKASAAPRKRRLAKSIAKHGKRSANARG
jgi:hypothetical protein